MSRLHTPRVVVLVVALLTAACGGAEQKAVPVPAEAIQRRDIVIDAQATGTVEPINVVDIKSRASGQIIKMAVEVGSVVKQGDVIVQIDTRDVQNQFDQAQANAKAAEASLSVADAQRTRSDELYKGKVITRAENETADLQFAQSTAQVVSARASLDIARQRLEDAVVRAPISGTIITKNVSLGTIITSSLNAVGGGTTLVQMADLSKVRSRALVNETDVGGLRPGQEVKVTIDAFPDRPFFGTVEKIEPQAVVQQSVTMFPVLISLRNEEGLLRPGMNGEVSVTIDRKQGVLAVSNDAVRSPREIVQAAMLIGLNPDSAKASLDAQGGGRKGGPGGGPGGPSATAQGDSARKMGGGPTSGGANGSGPNGGASSGGPSGGPSGGGEGGGRRGRGGMPVGDGSARAVAAARGANPMGSKVRPGLVFVQDAKGNFAPRLVRLGVRNYDFSEVVSGLQEGEKVAMLAAAQLQALRQQRNEQFKQMSGGGMPGSQKQGAAPAGGGAGGGQGGGGGGGRPRP